MHVTSRGSSTNSNLNKYNGIRYDTVAERGLCRLVRRTNEYTSRSRSLR